MAVDSSQDPSELYQTQSDLACVLVELKYILQLNQFQSEGEKEKFKSNFILDENLLQLEYNEILLKSKIRNKYRVRLSTTMRFIDPTPF